MIQIYRSDVQKIEQRLQSIFILRLPFSTRILDVELESRPASHSLFRSADLMHKNRSLRTKTYTVATYLMRGGNNDFRRQWKWDYNEQWCSFFASDRWLEKGLCSRKPPARMEMVREGHPTSERWVVVRRFIPCTSGENSDDDTDTKKNTGRWWPPRQRRSPMTT